ncbi:haloacid dehalogenase-like hydrolase [Blastopirellula sp. JC732]|uniref:phosphoglycolate phosphatase n=1 Tax=Blastopirellula sediminis TaxID=2894196 RepID=A0A9X1MTP5_9BACT|nr:HAD hydrolase-like protein [Blastopirellula sediminis]MCC9604819.1 haloacid dehalogenase-like hydrolase [Blastopirellula sediminis]MCC9631882.1 haloacid dehalogenase-like hydrolase [Blastopirellula sediminis]
MKICLFDIDGTLVLTDGAGKDAMIDSFQSTAGIDVQTTAVRVSGKTDRGIAKELFDAHNKELTEEAWQLFLTSYMTGLARNLPLRQGRVLPGIEALLNQLAEREDVALGLLTGNVAQGAYLKLTHYDLMHHFAFGGYGDLHPDRNDVAQAAKDACEAHLGHPVAGDQIWVIGDTANDVRCARHIGAKAVAVATGVFDREVLAKSDPDLLFDDLEDFGPLLEAILE